ncbi:hypothetical protein HYPSUDRAFT_137927 [Hypholoma sublateritium FD-334 SS-4]|uniref:SGF29 C-terminal domain-containing protein n=1 Tax=Hypholoma sublateritium (strain FD-334 SS-4) TaxID=945553 RepID=A0A0D2MHV0_HYPSF|nr:hypothetical protein HYPSUDRAFT_137927 [Hypholoma sublateritium FD-334 SS-4]
MYSRSGAADTIGRVNRLISVWPTDDTLPAEGLASLKTNQGKLTLGLNEIISQARKEAEVLDDALERVGVLIALRKAPELSMSAEKRNKRPRAPSPSGTPVPAQSASAYTRSVSITLPPRTNSVGPTSNLRDSRAKKDSLVLKQQPLQQGRKVAFRPPKGADAEEGTWIIAEITRIINSSKDGGKYEVQDVEPQENGEPGVIYTASLKSIVPLPDPTASVGSPAHMSLHPIFPIGSTVLALYPDTSCFYRAEVISIPPNDKVSLDADFPSSILNQNKSSLNKYYRVKFEDDEDMIHNVQASYVVQFPQHLLNASKPSVPK